MKKRECRNRKGTGTTAFFCVKGKQAVTDVNLNGNNHQEGRIEVDMQEALRYSSND